MANWKSLDHLYKKRIANIIYQAFYKKAPDGINSLFTRHSSLRNHRDNLKLLIQRPNTDFLRYSFSHRASILWNNLPLHLKNKPNLGSFKLALKENSDFLDKITFNQGRSQPFCREGFPMYIACPIDNRTLEALFTRGVRRHAPRKNFWILDLQKWCFLDSEHKFQIYSAPNVASISNRGL